MVTTRPLYEIRLKPMDYRILFVTDVHLIDEEFKNTVGYVEAQENVLRRIIKGAKEGVYNVVVFLGDLFDRPYKDVGKALYHISMFEELYSILEGRVFKVIGNHPLNKKKNSVLTFFLTGALKSARIEREHSVIQTTENGFTLNYGLKNPLIYAPDRIFVNGSLINLFHFNKRNKDYFDDLFDLTDKPKVHIGCYHDNIMTEQVRKVVNEMSTGGKFVIPTIMTVENTGILRNVDYAMIGDIHTKIGEFRRTDTSTGKTTIADIAGALGRTANHRAQQHNEVFLPLMTITQEGEVTKEHVHFQLTDYRKIFKVDLQEEDKEQRSKMTDFKSAIDVLKTPDSFEDAIKLADVEPRTKDILTQILNEGDSEISYLKRAKEHNLI